ncbi:hypothetical protein [Phenylobacterium sp.]|jgi:hypothetical protein|uniref:hypothetical protein n=1 Tax=Phenylobacterium sp. TaxID=1871053 RepID=UPI002F93EA72
MTRHLYAPLILAAAALGAGASLAQAPVPPPKHREVASPGAARDAAAAFRTDTAEVRLAARGAKGDKLEYMVRMKAGDTLTYAWDAPGAGEFWHEFHGHTPDTVTFYKKAAGAKHSGVLVAPFDGVHGWYFENRTAKPVVVRLRMGGFYALERGR